MRQMIRCKHCREWVPRNPRLKNQKYCGRKPCQRARKAEWQRTKIKNDPQYKADQDQAKAESRKQNPQYSKEYRNTHPDYCDRNRELQKHRDQKRRDRIAALTTIDSKTDGMNASLNENNFNTVTYIESVNDLAKMDASDQLNDLKSSIYIVLPKIENLAKMDASQEKFAVIPEIYIDLAKMDTIDSLKLTPYVGTIPDRRDQIQKRQGG